VPLQVVGGNAQAEFPITTLSAGHHTVSAAYNGDSTFNTSNGTLSHDQTVNALATMTAVVSSQNPSNVGQQVTFTATVAPASVTGTPTGTVTFTIDGTAQTPVPLQVVGGNDQASFPISTLAARDQTVSAMYNGDSTFSTSTGALSPNQTVNSLPATMTTVVSSLNPSTFGDSVTFTATVAPASGIGTPTGTVTFTIDGQAQTPVPLQVVGGNDQAQFPISTLPGGTHTVRVMYNCDSMFAPSTGALSPDQTFNTALTTTSLVSAQNPATFGQPITFTATVSVALVTGVATLPAGDPPTGTVTLLDGTTTPGSMPLDSSGQAAFSVSSLSVGTHSITAHYNGDIDFAPNTSNALSQVVNPSSAVAPTVVLLQRFGFHMQPTSIVLTFSTALDPAAAQNVANYTIVTLGGKGVGGSMVGHVTHIVSAIYDPTTLTVTLHPAHRMDIHNFYKLTVNGLPPEGLTGATGLPLDGAGNGVPGSNYVADISAKTLAGPAPGFAVAVHRGSEERAPSRSTAGARAVDALAVRGELTASPFMLRRSSVKAETSPIGLTRNAMTPGIANK
jgi:hypothetical protein